MFFLAAGSWQIDEIILSVLARETRIKYHGFLNPHFSQPQSYILAWQGESQGFPDSIIHVGDKRVVKDVRCRNTGYDKSSRH